MPKTKQQPRRIISGGEFGNKAYHHDKNVVISGGEFGNDAFWYSESVIINGGKFKCGAFYESKNTVVKGGEFGYEAFYDSENTYVLNITGNFKGIYAPKSGIIVAKDIRKIHKQDDRTETISKIFALNCPKSKLITKINSRQLEKIEKIVANNSYFQKGLEQATKRLRL